MRLFSGNKVIFPEMRDFTREMRILPGNERFYPGMWYFPGIVVFSRILEPRGSVQSQWSLANPPGLPGSVCGSTGAGVGGPGGTRVVGVLDMVRILVPPHGTGPGPGLLRHTRQMDTLDPLQWGITADWHPGPVTVGNHCRFAVLDPLQWESLQIWLSWTRYSGNHCRLGVLRGGAVKPRGWWKTGEKWSKWSKITEKWSKWSKFTKIH